MSAITKIVLEDGQIQLSGKTYNYREAIKTAGGRWKAAEKVWILPVGTNTGFLGLVSAEELRLSQGDRCCLKCMPEEEYWQGPWWWNCSIHGKGAVHRYMGD
jgi:hypothetical protein